MNSNQIYQGFDEVNLGNFLALTAGDTVLQTSATCNNLRLARSVASQTTASQVEMVIYSPLFLSGALTNLPQLSSSQEVMVGIVVASSPLNNWPGFDATSFGLNPGTGDVYNNNAIVLTITPYTFGDYIGIICDPFRSLLQFTKNGVANGAPFTIASGQAWFYAATVSGAPGTYAIVANSGQTPMVYPATLLTGWGSFRASISPMNLATEPYMSVGTDLFPYEKYAGDINPLAQQTTINDSVNFWPWGNSAPAELGSGGLVQFQVDDPNGLYTDLTADAAYNDPVVISRVQSGSAMATAEVLFTGVFDHCEVDTRQTKQVFARDQLSRLQVAISRALFPPGVDASVAGKPRPVSMGVCRNYEPTLYDPVNFLYAIHDAPISALGRTRVAGKQVILGADFQMSSDLAGIDFVAAPVGKITVESTSYGGAFNAGSPDYLAGVGVFGSVTNGGGGVTGTSTTSITVGTGSRSFTISSILGFATGAIVKMQSRGTPGATMTGTVTGGGGGPGFTTLTNTVTSVTGSGTFNDWNIIGGVNQPTGWTAGGGYPNDPHNSTFQVQGSAPNKFIRQAQEASAIFWWYPSDVPIVLHANHSYAYKIDLAAIPYFGPVQDASGAKYTNTPGFLVFGYNTNQFIAFNMLAKIPIDHVGTYSGVFINNTGSNQNLVIGFLPNNTIQGSGGIFSNLDITDIIINELPALSDNVSLTGDTFTQLSKDILVYHGPLADAELNTTDTDAIQTATGYSYGIHINSTDTPIVKDIDQQLLDSVFSCRYPDEFGNFRTGRLFAPEGVLVGNLAGSLTQTDTCGEIICYPDMAENLTTKISGCKNYSPLNGSDYGSTTTSDTPLNVRAQLGTDFQWTVASGIQLAQRYFNQYGKDALQTLLDQMPHGLAEIIYVNKLYATPRNFYVGKFFEPIGRTFKLMQTWKLTYPLPTLAAGTQLVIVGRQRQPQQLFNTLILWGN